MRTETLIIGCKSYGHDAAVFVIAPEAKEVFGMATERLTRRKHDKTPPMIALERCIEYWNLDTKAVQKVVLCDSFQHYDPGVDWDNAAEIEYALAKLFPYEAGKKEFGKLSGAQKLLAFLQHPLGWYILWQQIKRRLGLARKRYGGEMVLPYLNRWFPNTTIEHRAYDHHYCHALCSYITSPFDAATVFTFDGWGDCHCSRVYLMDGKKTELIASSPKVMPDPIVPPGTRALPSIGGIYQWMTDVLGFTPNADEGKVEALAAYGKPVPKLLGELHELFSIDEDLSLNVDADKAPMTLAEPHLKEFVGTHGREDVCATVQTFLEEVTKKYLPKIFERTKNKNLVLSGGVAANVINNLSIFENFTKNLHITPAMADDGSAQGAAYAYLLENNYDISWLKGEQIPYWGTSYTKQQVKETLQKYPQLTAKDLGDEWPERTAELLVAGKIGAIFHGRMEWGPRALGNRSIIADARRKDFREIINRNIKRRPAFQPFCPSILAEEKDRLFEEAYLNKHMTCAFRLKKEFWEQFPSAIHIDGTARAQFVEEKDNPMYWRLLKKVKELTGTGIIINTSFNKHGRTIVESPEDAIRDFLDTDMDYVVIEGFLVTRKGA